MKIYVLLPFLLFSSAEVFPMSIYEDYNSAYNASDDSSSSPLASGAAGAVAGGSMGGIPGAVIGGILGVAGGMLGSSSAADAAREAVRNQRDLMLQAPSLKVEGYKRAGLNPALAYTDGSSYPSVANSASAQGNAISQGFNQAAQGLTSATTSAAMADAQLKQAEARLGELALERERNPAMISLFNAQAFNQQEQAILAGANAQQAASYTAVNLETAKRLQGLTYQDGVRTVGFQLDNVIKDWEAKAAVLTPQLRALSLEKLQADIYQAIEMAGYYSRGGGSPFGIGASIIDKGLDAAKKQFIDNSGSLTGKRPIGSYNRNTPESKRMESIHQWMRDLPPRVRSLFGPSGYNGR